MTFEANTDLIPRANIVRDGKPITGTVYELQKGDVFRIAKDTDAEYLGDRMEGEGRVIASYLSREGGDIFLSEIDIHSLMPNDEGLVRVFPCPTFREVRIDTENVIYERLDSELRSVGIRMTGKPITLEETL